ncbi:MAG: hypothetical protein MR366_01190, partial [Succinivibrio sp.]|nr:hypothetical protein [Succinivibrio sp.]
MIKQTKNAISFLNKAYRAIYAHAYLKGLANSLALISCVAVAPCANAVVSEQCTLSEDGNTYTCTSVKDTSSITVFKDFNSEVSGKELEVKDSTLSDVVTSSSGITANNNKLTVSNSTITEYGTVAGKADNIKYLSDGTREILNNDVTANNNTLIIKDKSDVTGAVQAGHAYAVSSNEVLKATANDNKIEVSDSNISESFVIGGYASSNQAVAKLNKVTFNNVNLTDGRVTGGQASYANENTVEIADSTITDPVFGTVTGGWATTEANDNEVNVKNLTIKGVSEEGGGQIIGGFASGKANNNTVNINGGSAIVKTNYEAVAGGYADFEASGNTVKIENFDTVNEDSPSYTGNIFGCHVSQEGSVANNNQVTISDSNVGRVYGGAYSRAESSGNTVTIENSSVRDHVVGGSSWASRAEGENGNAGIAKNNKVYFNNSTFNGSMYQTGLQGAGAGNEATGNLVSLKNSKILLLTEDAKNSAQTQGATGRVNASNNTLSITDNSLVEGGQVEAAMTYANYDYQNEDRTASSNKLIIKDSTVNGKARGGVTWVNAQIADFWPENGNPGRLYTVGLKSTLQGNSAEIVNSSVDLVYAAEFQADWVGEDADTRDFSGVVLDGNTVTIDGKSNIKGDAIAATAVSSHYENNNDKDFLFYQYQGTATKNVLNVNGGTIGGNAIAARADVANNNTVNILGGTFLGHVYAVNAKTEAKGNTVNIGADGKAPTDFNLSSTTIAAYDKSSSQDLNHESNSLNVYTKDLVANNVEAFDEYNFYL